MSEKKTFCQLLDEAIQDEEKAKDFYAALIEAADREYPVEFEKYSLLYATITSVRDAEDTHKALWTKLRATLCERK